MITIPETNKDYICDIQAPCFQTLSPQEINFVSQSKTQVLFHKGDSLTKQGVFASYILFVMSGLAKQYIENDNNKSFNLRIIRQGEFVGLSSVFAKNTYYYSSTALTECRTFLVEKAAIEKVIKQNGDFAFNIIRRYCELNTTLFNSLQNIIFKQMNGRLADTLLYIDRLKNETQDIFRLLSRKDLAAFSGISTENVVKLLKGLEKDNIIILKDKDIIITDKKRLEKISKTG
ncbi:MAG: Crp/Fnr family transcriptional regulator [Bacteroidales bacterium]|nr:Crp/Fnr family transcriptional regulator [Bacteroidales bacterium]